MKDTYKIGKKIHTDVLVIGGSGAGVQAAISAVSQNVKTTLVSKGIVGRSGNAIMAGASFAMDGPSAIDYGYDGDPEFTKDVWFEEIVKQEFFLSDQKIVERFVDGAAPLVKQVVDWGQSVKQFFYFFKPGGFFTSGNAIGLALRKGIQEHPEIDVLEDVIITDLLTNDTRCVGALGVDVYSGEILLFEAKAVILATGGFQPFSFKCTVSEMNGDGMAMALRAGVTLADMEFPLFIPGVLLSPPIHRGSIFPFIYNVISGSLPSLPPPRIMNSRGENINTRMPSDIAGMATASEWQKIIYTYYWGREVSEGRGSPGGGVFFSFNHIPKNVFISGTDTFMGMLSLWYKKPWKYQGDDFGDLRDAVLAGDAWEVGMSHEYSNGGVLVNEKTETGLRGLYAAGEVSSGCFGALRIHDALTEMLVQGHTAGESAGRYCADAEEPQIDGEQVESHIERICSPLERAEGISPTEVRKQLEAHADSGFGYFRDEEKIATALAEVERIRRELIPGMVAKSRAQTYNLEWIEALGLENLALCLEAGLRAAQMRKESRGTHIRVDYPTVDHEKFLVRICQELKSDSIELSTRKPVVTRMKPPSGTAQDIMEYALWCEPKFKNADASQLPDME
jgi:succinate dehydrogenase / fumarate reductase flavoprotein subunit